jgi:predicted nucleotidyltransferase
MELGVPIRTVMPTVHGLVLTVLAVSTEPMSGRQISKRLEGRASQRGVANVLGDLVATGLVYRSDHPPVALYSLNRDHVAARPVEQLADLNGEVLRRLREAIRPWRPPPVAAVLFGSAVRRDGDRDSDIDIFVVRPVGTDSDDDKWGEQMLSLAESVQRWTGNRADIVEYGEQELRGLDLDAEPVLGAVLAEGVPLHGEDLRALLADR